MAGAMFRREPEEDAILELQDRSRSGLKGEASGFSEVEKEDLSEDVGSAHSNDGCEAFDPFVPFPVDPNEPEEERILSFRAVFIGCVLGALVNASNIYLGLRTGWTFSANMFGAMVGFAFLKSCSITLAKNFPLFGGDFGPKENAIAQTAATAAGGCGGIFVSAIPAMYQLKLLSAHPIEDFGRLLTFTLVSAYYGLFFATPLRKFFLIYVARELRLIFPTATATAMTIRAMHLSGSSAGRQSKKRTRVLIIAFTIAMILRIVSQYAPGILWDWHIFLWFYQWSGHSSAIAVENWGWMIEWTPAFIGTGLLVGLNAALSFFGGSVLAWGIVGPCLVRWGLAYGVAPMDGDPKWGNLVNFYSLNLQDPKDHPSPRYWLLWPGVFVMITTSFTELLVQYKLIWNALRVAGRAITASFRDLGRKRGCTIPPIEKPAGQRNVIHDEDIVGPEEQVSFMMWAPPLLVTVVLTCLIMGLQFHLNVDVSILSIVLGFVFAFLVIQCNGATDIAPATAAAKATQLILGGITDTQGYSTSVAQRLNIIGGAVATGAASQSSDLVSDFRIGFLLRTPPRQQWYAQAIGSIVAIFLAPAMFILFTQAYPCVIDLTAESCEFSGPSIAAWRAVAIAVTDPSFPVPKSSYRFSLVFGAVGILSVLIRHYLLTGHRAKYRAYLPNFMAVGLAFILPQTVYGTAMLMGATISYFWAKKWPNSFHLYCYSVAAGGISGEGMGGVVNAVFQILRISGGGRIGTGIGCPYGELSTC